MKSVFGGVLVMNFVNLLIILLLGVSILSVGYILKKRWIKLLSIIPFALALIEITRQSFL